VLWVYFRHWRILLRAIGEAVKSNVLRGIEGARTIGEDEHDTHRASFTNDFLH